MTNSRMTNGELIRRHSSFVIRHSSFVIHERQVPIYNFPLAPSLGRRARLRDVPARLVGGLVTTTDAGMAVPDWPSTYGYNLFLYPWQTWLAGPWDIFVEH